MRARAKEAREDPVLVDRVGKAYDPIPLEPDGIRRAQHLTDFVLGHARGQVARACITRYRDAESRRETSRDFPTRVHPPIPRLAIQVAPGSHMQSAVNPERYPC